MRGRRDGRVGLETKSRLLCSTPSHERQGGGFCDIKSAFAFGARACIGPYTRSKGVKSISTGVSRLCRLARISHPHLPFLRRYGRALTGSQVHGDNFVRATLETIVAQPDDFRAMSIRASASTAPFTRSGRAPISTKAKSRRPRSTARRASLRPDCRGSRRCRARRCC